MLIPVFVVPLEGITTAGQGILLGYHLLVALALVTFIIGAVRV
jgi:hypothetical protein